MPTLPSIFVEDFFTCFLAAFLRLIYVLVNKNYC
jgi:hypothetical protein